MNSTFPLATVPASDYTVGRARVRAPLLERQEIAPGHLLWRLSAPGVAHSCRPGQFLHVLPRTAASSDPLLRRAFSISSAQPNEGIIEFIFRVGGRGTRLMAEHPVGAEVDLLAPLGNGFDFALAEENGRALLIGGGVGVPPLLFAAAWLRERNVEVEAFLGARSAREVLGEELLKRLGCRVQIATDDGSQGLHGLVTTLVEQRLAEFPEAKNAPILSCGPFPMLRAVAQLGEKWKMATQVSLEENMPCGIGVCNGCVVAMKHSGSALTEALGNDFDRYQRICVNGPVCRAEEVEWSA